MTPSHWLAVGVGALWLAALVADVWRARRGDERYPQDGGN